MITEGEPSADDIRKFDSLSKELKALGRVMIAYSGGVDSSFLALVAHRSVGAGARIVTAVSPSLARADLERARGKLASANTFVNFTEKISAT